MFEPEYIVAIVVPPPPRSHLSTQNSQNVKSTLLGSVLLTFSSASAFLWYPNSIRIQEPIECLTACGAESGPEVMRLCETHTTG